jgi:hypothetical protein
MRGDRLPVLGNRRSPGLPAAAAWQNEEILGPPRTGPELSRLDSSNAAITLTVTTLWSAIGPGFLTGRIRYFLGPRARTLCPVGT